MTLSLLVLIRILPEKSSGSWTECAIYAAMAVVAGLVRVGLPTPAGTLRLSFLFVLFGLSQLPHQQAVVIGALAALTEAVYPRRREMRVSEVAMRVAVAVLATAAASEAHDRMLALMPDAPAAALPMAASTFFLVSAFALASVHSLREQRSLRDIWQHHYLWSLPYYLSGAALAALFPALKQLAWWQAGGIILPVFFLVWRAYALQIRRLESEKRHSEELSQLQFQMIEALAHTLEARDTGTQEHLRRVSTYAIEIGRAMGLGEKEIDDLRAAALLHDIGKLAVPEHILSKPGRLTPEEFERLKVHPLVGADILERSSFSPGVVGIVCSHHEKWDGSGYPYGLKEEQIPLGARILAVADCLDAMATDRQHRRALLVDQALAEIVSLKGKNYDPAVVDALSRCCADIDRMVRRQPMPVQEAHRTGASELQEFIDRPAEDFLSAIASARQEEQLLADLLRIVGCSLSLTQTIGALSRRLTQVVPHETVVLYQVGEKGLVPETVVGEKFSLFARLEIAPGAGVSGWAAAHQQPVLNGDPGLEGATPALTEYKSALAIPLESSLGGVGVLTFYSTKAAAYAPLHLRVLNALAPRLATAVEHSLKFREAESQAACDALTGLPNAGSLMARIQVDLARCTRAGENLVVLLCDLDGFKQVNDRFGHLTGNRVLQLVAQGLKEQIREYDFVARMGGDEFVVLMPGLTPEAVRQRRNRFSDLVVAAGRECCGEDTVSVSIGEARFPVDGRTADELLARADDLMYREKNNRKLFGDAKRLPTAHNWVSQIGANG